MTIVEKSFHFNYFMYIILSYVRVKRGVLLGKEKLYCRL